MEGSIQAKAQRLKLAQYAQATISRNAWSSTVSEWRMIKEDPKATSWSTGYVMWNNLDFIQPKNGLIDNRAFFLINVPFLRWEDVLQSMSRSFPLPWWKMSNQTLWYKTLVFEKLCCYREFIHSFIQCLFSSQVFLAPIKSQSCTKYRELLVSITNMASVPR